MCRLELASLWLILLIFCVATPARCYRYETKHFDQIIDHFNFASYGNKTFKQRYLVSDGEWIKEKGPIFFYTGNEGSIVNFLENTGFMFDIAPEFKALLVFAEHRFYGESLPFGNASFTPDNLGLLTVEQALADYATLLLYLKDQLKCPECKVVVFGGSYGGMLSAYMRFKYPNIVDGAIASSAPLYSTAGQGSQNYFFRDVTKAFEDASSTSSGCVPVVKQAFRQIENLVSRGQPGLDVISSTFKLCKKLTDKTEVPHLLGWIRNAFTIITMANYPYPAMFLGKLPAWPVNVSCEILEGAEKTPLKGLAGVTSLFYNGTDGHLQCMDTATQFVECSDPTGCGLGNDAKAWDWQACTEITLPAGSNNVTDMFPLLPFTQEMRNIYCMQKWNVSPKPTWLNVIMWGKDVKMASNIVFCNGALDPWRDGGILTVPSSTQRGALDVCLIYQGAHHLDLRGSNPADPIYAIQARNLHRTRIRSWISQ